MQVLRTVHKEALAREISVGFLGDFFDHVYNKGTLPVDILNALMSFFSNEWSVPMIMIPGNHDYFDASETEHGLSPFKYASKHITVIDQPTVIDNKLWMPWRRDPVECAKIIADNPSVSVIFGHFDIIGFKLNANRVSNEGLSTDMFPTDIPIYTGHYHTPQKHGNIRYLGSPYQLTLSEAEDQKALVVLSADGTFESEIPISIGRKQYKWTAMQLLDKYESLKPYDRVSVSADNSILDVVEKLRANGVEIHVRKEHSSIETRIQKPENLSEMDILDKYASMHEICRESKPWSFLLGLLTSIGSQHLSQQPVKNVVPIRMSISGFGPFAGPIVVALKGGGFTLVSGHVSETDGSNGSGKSMLTCGGLLWVFSGITDGRWSIAFDDSSIIHNGSGPACITLIGSCDGATFKIKRTLQSNPRKHTLVFNINGEDRTRSTLSATQRALASEIFGRAWSANELSSWLLKNCCWTQQHVERFCDASDLQAKIQIQKIAKMELWISLHTKAKEMVKDTNQKLKTLIVEENIAHAEYIKTNERHSRTIQLHEQWNRQHSIRLTRSQQDVEKMSASLDRVQIPPTRPCKPDKYNLNSAKRNFTDATTCKIRLITRIEDIERRLPDHWQSIKPIPKPVPVVETRLEQCKATMSARRIQLNVCRETLEKMKNSSVCPQCHRPFEKLDTGLIAECHQKVEAARVKHMQSVDKWKKAAEEYNQQKIKESDYQENAIQIKNINKLRELKNELANIDTTSLERKLNSESAQFEQQMRMWSSYEESLRIQNEFRAALSALTRVRDMISLEQNPHDTSDRDLLQASEKRDKLSEDISICRRELEDQKRVVQWLGPRGIQTYVMEYTVKKLGALTTLWLQRFFTTDAFFKVSFDSKERLVRYVSVPNCSGVMSGGQFRRVQLASFLAWKSMDADKWPLMIMDECCQSMDPPGISSVQEILRDWCEEDTNRTCFFITHEPGQFRDTSIYHNHMQIRHKRGRSAILQEQPQKRKRK